MQAEGWLTTRSMGCCRVGRYFSYVVIPLRESRFCWMPSTVFFVGVVRSFALVLWFVFVGVGVWLCDVVLIEGCGGCWKCWCIGTYHKGCVVQTQSCLLVLIWLKCFLMAGLPTESQQGCVVATSKNVVVDWVF